MPQKNGYDLNISEEEVRKKLTKNENPKNICKNIK